MTKENNFFNNAYSVLLVSGIIPATGLLLLTLFFIPKILVRSFEDYKSVVLLLSMLLGVFGYVGLIRSLVYQANNYRKRNAIFIGLGLLGMIVFLILDGMMQFINWVLDFDEIGEITLVMWPIIVSIVAII